MNDMNIQRSALSIWSWDLVGKFKRPDAEGFLEVRHNIHSGVRCGDLLYNTVNQMPNRTMKYPSSSRRQSIQPSSQPIPSFADL